MLLLSSNCLRRLSLFALPGIIAMMTGCEKMEYEHSYAVTASIDCYTNRGEGVWSVKKFSQKQFVIDSNSPIHDQSNMEKVFSEIAGKVPGGYELSSSSHLTPDGTWEDTPTWERVYKPYDKFDFAYLRMTYSDTKDPMVSTKSRTYFVLPTMTFYTSCPSSLFDKKTLQNILNTAIPEE